MNGKHGFAVVALAGARRYAGMAFLGAVCALALAWPAAAGTVYVNGTTGNDAWTGRCETWNGAACGPKRTVQAGINAAVAGDTVVVADGTYTGTANKNLDFGGKAITVRSASGDPATCIIDCQGSGRGFYFHSRETAAAAVAGLTIRSGSVTVDGTGGAHGGAVYCSNSSNPTLANCVLSGNAAIRSGNIVSSGGGLACYSGSSPTLTNCTISGNTAHMGGGVICDSASDATLTKCTIADNSVTGDGGGMECISASPTLVNCTIVTNRASYHGAGIDCERSSPNLTNCTIVANTVPSGPGGGLECDFSSNPTVTNCIIWANTPDGIRVTAGAPVVSYSDVQNGYAGLGNLNANPLFVIGGNYRLRPTSPCIDAGDPAAGFSLEPEPDGGRINMGGYGNTPEAETKGWIYIDGYSIARRTRVGRTLFEYELTATVRNASPENVANLVATLLAAPANVQVVDGTVNIGSVAANTTVEGGDTFTIQVDRSTPVSPLPISWRVTYGGGMSAEFTTLLDLWPPRTGDANCDGVMDFGDINPFVLALTDEQAYYARYPDCDWLSADCNGDATVDFEDINAFVALLAG